MIGEMSTALLWQAWVLVLTPVLPLVLAAALIPRRWREPVIRLAPWASLPALIAVTYSSAAVLNLPWVLLGARLGVDDVGQVFLLFTAMLWLVAGLYGRTYLAGDDRRVRFFAFYLLTMSGNLGLIVAQDVLSFYLFFALMTFSAYGLIVHKQDTAALRAGRVYIRLAVLGEVLLFAGFIIGTRHAGGLSLDQFAGAGQSDLVIGLLTVGFGIKVGSLPLHVWLPLAHPVAPTPASALLSGAIIKAGLLGWLRFLPLGEAALPELSIVFVVAGLCAAVYAVLVGLFQDEPKTVLAYSSISQMGLMTIGLGVGLAAPELGPLCVSAILTFALHHAFAKAALFLGVGVAAASSKGTIQRRLVFCGLLLPSLALAGLPLTSGAVAKVALRSLTEVLPAPWANWMAVSLSAIAVGTTFLMARFLYLVSTCSFGQRRQAAGLWVPWTAMLGIVAFSIWLWPEAHELILRTNSAAEIWKGLWPVGAGAIGAWVALRKLRIAPAFRLPPGDLLIVASWVSNRLGRAWVVTAGRYRERKEGPGPDQHPAIVGSRPARADLLIEMWLRRWEVFGMVFLSVIVLIFVLLALV